MRCVGTMQVSNWTIYICTMANTTWRSLPRSTSEKCRGTEGQTHKCCQICAKKSSHLKPTACILAHYITYLDHRDQKAKKGKENREPADMVKFSKVKPVMKFRTIHDFRILLYVCFTVFLFFFFCSFSSLLSRSL